MRRTVTPLLLASIAALTLAACGSDGASGSDSLPTPADSTAADGSITDGSVPGDTVAANPDKPDVEIPAEAPTELVVTVLEEGTGPAAEVGDTVVVDYVGVRSSDGVEFDNSYDRGAPLPLVLGAGRVIQGWEDGLVGAQTGARIRLDIPSDLAYGDQARSEVIGANEDLTFVVDVRSVIAAPDAADAPTEPGVPASEGATEVTTVDLVEGDGPVIEADQTAVLHLVLFRGDNLVVLDSTWATEPIQIPMTEGSFPGLLEGLEGMKVGGRRAITIPPEQGFGAEGSPTIGLPRDTDIIMVVDLLGAY